MKIRYILLTLFLFACLSMRMSAQNSNSSEEDEFIDFRKELQGE